jgi:hypothetical protein
MIRAVLASPWLPLLYWTAALVAMIYDTHHKSLKPRPRDRQVQMVSRTPAPTPTLVHAGSLTPPQSPLKLAMAVRFQPTHFWSPQFSILQKTDSPAQKILSAGATQVTLPTEARMAVSPPITMLSIRVDPQQNVTAKTLAIHCRTTVPLSNVHGRTVIIHGVVSEEVVSSTGKIVIMAGSRVVGSGRLDLENGRFKSNGRWSIFIDDTELQVQAQLLDRPEGLPGILGREPLNEDQTLRGPDSRSIVVPRNAPFVLELRGEIQLHDLKSNEASN